MGVLQNDATPPRSMQLSTSHGCRGALCAPAGDETSPLRILLITFSFLQQTPFLCLFSESAPMATVTAAGGAPVGCGAVILRLCPPGHIPEQEQIPVCRQLQPIPA